MLGGQSEYKNGQDEDKPNGDGTEQKPQPQVEGEYDFSDIKKFFDSGFKILVPVLLFLIWIQLTFFKTDIKGAVGVYGDVDVRTAYGETLKVDDGHPDIDIPVSGGRVQVNDNHPDVNLPIYNGKVLVEDLDALSTLDEPFSVEIKNGLNY